jgi:hypothetical protein
MRHQCPNDACILIRQRDTSTVKPPSFFNAAHPSSQGIFSGMAAGTPKIISKILPFLQNITCDDELIKIKINWTPLRDLKPNSFKSMGDWFIKME